MRIFSSQICSHIDKVELSKSAPVNITQSSGAHSYGGLVSRPGLVVET
jgi:hypothetical protein